VRVKREAPVCGAALRRDLEIIYIYIHIVYIYRERDKTPVCGAALRRDLEIIYIYIHIYCVYIYTRERHLCVVLR
jgi:hypothetical protein